MFNYVGVLQPTTSISHALKCYFLNEPNPNLVVTKSNKIHIFSLTDEGLKPRNFIPIFGNILVIEKIPSKTDKHSKQDNLFILTEDLDYSIISYTKNTNNSNNINSNIISLLSGSIKEDIGRMQDKVLYSIDNYNNFILISAYCNIFRLICVNETIQLKDELKDFKIKNNFTELLFLNNFNINFYNFNNNITVDDKNLITFAMIKCITKEKNQGLMNYNNENNKQHVVETEDEVVFETIQFKIDKNSIKQCDYQDKINIFDKHKNIGLNIINNRTFNNTNNNINVTSIKNANEKIMEPMDLIQRIDLNKNPTVSQMITHPNGLVILFFANYVQLYIFNFNTKLLEPDKKNKIFYDERRFDTYGIIDEKNYKYLISDEFGNLFLFALVDPFLENEDYSEQLQNNKICADLNDLNKNNKQSMYLQFLGEINYASSLCYLDNSYLFIASKTSNSQLIKLEKKDNKFLHVIEEFNSLAPINNIALVNNIGEENNIEIITASGVDKSGCIKNIKKGTTINFFGDINIRGIKNIFNIELNFTNKNNKFYNFILSTTNNSFVINYNLLNNEITLSKVLSFPNNEIVLYASNKNNYLLIVTNIYIYIYQVEQKDENLKLKLKQSFIDKNYYPLLIKFSKKLSSFYIYSNDKNLIEYKIIKNDNDNNITISSTIILSKIDISSFDVCEHFLVFSLWNLQHIGIYSFKTKSLNYLKKLTISEDVQISSVQIYKKEGVKFIFISFSNGKLCYYKLKEKFRNLNYYEFSESDFMFKRKCNLSNENFVVKKIGNNKNSVIFLNTLTPSFGYIIKDNLILSNFNIKNCENLIKFDENKYCFLFEDSIKFGTMNNSQSLNITSKAMNSYINNIKIISFEDEKVTLTNNCISNNQLNIDNNKNNTMIIDNMNNNINLTNNNNDYNIQSKRMNYILTLLNKRISNNKIKSSFILSDLNFKEISNYEFKNENEIATCFTEITNTSLTLMHTKLFAIGTGICENLNEEPAIGHIYLLEINIKDNYNFKFIQEFETKGGISKMISCQNILYLAIGNVLYIYRLNKELLKNIYDFKLLRKCSDFTLINDLFFFDQIYKQKDKENFMAKINKLKENKNDDFIKNAIFEHFENISKQLQSPSKNNEQINNINIHMFIVSDLYRSINLYLYDVENDILEENCKDYSLTWIFSISKCNRNTFYISDIDGNISGLQFNIYPKTDQDKFQFKKISSFNLGERINCIANTKIKNKELFQYSYKDENLILSNDEVLITYFGTLEGSLGIIIQLDEEIYKFLLSLQNIIIKKMQVIGNFSYYNYRKYKDGFNSKNSEGFVEGEIVLEFLNFEEEYKNEILKQLNNPKFNKTEDIIKILEILAKLH